MRWWGCPLVVADCVSSAIPHRIAELLPRFVAPPLPNTTTALGCVWGPILLTGRQLPPRGAKGARTVSFTSVFMRFSLQDGRHIWRPYGVHRKYSLKQCRAAIYRGRPPVPARGGFQCALALLFFSLFTIHFLLSAYSPLRANSFKLRQEGPSCPLKF